MKATHTPGPWLPNASEVYAEKTGKTVGRCDIGGRDAETDANARLIAVAPDLLAALESCVAHLQRIPDSKLARGHAEAYSLALDALRKAKGAA